MHISNWGVILTVVVVVLSFGLLGILTSYKYHKPTLIPGETFLSARGSVGWMPLGLSLYASCMGSWILFAPPELGALYGWVAVILYTLAVALPFVVMTTLGPSIRRIVGNKGFVLSDFVLQRYGKWSHLGVSGISLLGMWTSLAGELTFLGKAADCLSPGVSKETVIFLVSFSTLCYTLFSGLLAAILTDVVQAILVIVLGIGALIVTIIYTGIPAEVFTPDADTTKSGFISGMLITLSFFPAYLMDQGAWQRVWAGRGEKEVKMSFWMGGILIVPSIFLFGFEGILAGTKTHPHGLNPENASVSLFLLFSHLHFAWLYLVLLLTLSLVVSSVDTLQNALPALIASELVRNKLSFNYARLMTVLLNIPAICVALFWNTDILLLYLIGNLVSSAAIPIILLGLTDFITPRGAIIGFCAGIISIFFCGLGSSGGDFMVALKWFSLPHGVDAISSLITFIIVPLVSMMGGILTSWVDLRMNPFLRLSNNLRLRLGEWEDDNKTVGRDEVEEKWEEKGEKKGEKKEEKQGGKKGINMDVTCMTTATELETHSEDEMSQIESEIPQLV